MNWKEIKKKLKKLNTIFYINNHIQNYVTKWVFRVMFLVILIGFFYVAYTEDFDFTTHAYNECVGNQPCRNPFFECQNKEVTFLDYQFIDCKQFNKFNCVDGICNKELLDPHEILGEKPSKIYNNYSNFVLVICFIAILINHLIWWGKK